MHFQAPMLVVKDMSRARTFYETVLGQKVILDFGANITFDGGFALQTKETWMEFINKSEEEICDHGNNFELYFEEDDFTTFLTKLKEQTGIEYVHDVVEYPWGQSVVRIYDPDKNIIEIGQSMRSVIRAFLSQGLTPEETAKRTQHPLAFVKSCMD